MVELLLVKHAEKLAEDKIRQEKARAHMPSNKGQMEAALQVESASLDPLEASDDKQEDAPDGKSGEVSSCLPDVTLIATMEVAYTPVTWSSPIYTSCMFNPRSPF